MKRKLINLLICRWTAAAASLAAPTAAASTTALTAGAIGATQFFTTAAAGGTIAAGAAAGGSALSIGSILSGALTATNIISGVATAFGTLSDIRAGEEEAQVLEFQANEEDENAKLAAFNAKVEENDAREKMIKALAQNIAAAGASNIDLSSGTIQTGLGEIARKGNQNIDIIRTKGAYEISQRVKQAQQLRLQASASRRRGYTDAAFGVLDFARRTATRGSVPETEGVA